MNPSQNSIGGGEPYGKKIFITHKPSYELSPDTPAVEILFRIEKVSSKIGLFKLYIEPDYGESSQGPIGGVFTDNIEVKSKVNDKAKAQYIDSIQNILVPVAGHPGPPGMGQIIAVPQQGGGGRASEHVHAANHAIRAGHVGAHASSLGVSGHGLLSAPTAHQQLQHSVGQSDQGGSSVAPVRMHAFHGGGNARLGDGGGSATGLCFECACVRGHLEDSRPLAPGAPISSPPPSS